MGSELSAGDIGTTEKLVRALVLGGAALAGGGPSAIATALDVILGGRASDLVRARVEDLLNLLREEFSRVVGQDVPPDYLQSRDFAHLVILAVQAAAKERNREKLRDYARILQRTAVDPRGEQAWQEITDRAELALRALAELTTEDFTVLKAVIAWRRSAGLNGGPLNSAALDIHLPRRFPMDRVRAYLGRLERTGLVVAEGGLSGTMFKPTPLLDELMALLDGPG
jgi:hypothetical protein